MAALIKCLDNYTPTQFGENGHVEYGWSNSIQEKILQFSFQVTRTDEDGLNKLSFILRDIHLNDGYSHECVLIISNLDENITSEF